MSLCNARRRIMATIPVRKITITAELTRLNQWILGSTTWRYLSQRVAHRVDEYYCRLTQEETGWNLPLDAVGIGYCGLPDVVDMDRTIRFTVRIAIGVHCNLLTHWLHKEADDTILIPGNRLFRCQPSVLKARHRKGRVHDTRQQYYSGYSSGVFQCCLVSPTRIRRNRTALW